MPVSMCKLAGPRLLGPLSLGRYSRPSKHIRLGSGIAYSHEDAQRSATVDSLHDSIYFEPFVRAFLLGLGSAGLLEASHTLFSFASSQFDVAGHFAPLFYADHVTAICGWIVFYALDVLAIKAVLDSYKDGDERNAGIALTNLVTLPKKMLPVRLAVFKHFFISKETPIAGPTPFKPQTEGSFPSSPATAAFPAPPSVALPKPKTAKGTHNILPTTPPTNKSPRLGELRGRQGLQPGQLDPSIGDALARRRQEIADRRAYLHGFWYAAALSDSLKPGVPLGVDILGEKIVLFRDSINGGVRALNDVCPHRGAPFSAGWMKNIEGHDCVVCPYHGWAFDGDGRLHDVPAAENKGEWPKRSIVPAYDLEERGGFVWLWYGRLSMPRDARPPIPCVPELEDANWKAVYGEIEFEFNHSAVFENALDMAHIHYLHGDSFGNEEKPQIRDMTCTADAHSVTATFKLNNKPASPLWEWTKVPEVEVTAKAFLPSTSAISFNLNGLSFVTFVSTVPVSETKSVNRFALIRNLSWDKTGAFNAAAWDGWARRAMLKILGEDKVMVEQLRPEMLVKEYSVRADLPQVYFRKLRQQWVDLGFVKYPNGGLGQANLMKKEFEGAPGGGAGLGVQSGYSSTSDTVLPDL